MPLLVVRQAAWAAGDDPARFLLLREDGKSLPEPVAVPAAQGFAVEERPKSDLMAELRWYLESFLEYPFPPETGRAERVLRALRSWGEAAFEALFGDRVGGGFWAAATASGHERLRLQIRSDDPAVLAWPWEALHDPLVGPLGPLCQIERRLDAVGDPPPLATGLPRDRVHILLVTARPYEQDVAYRTVSRPLVELIARERLPADVHLLRPPTLARLREHLRQRPGFYHILHFDGHGGYLTPQEGTAPAALPAAHTFAGRVGKIAFEGERGGADYVSAEQLAPLLREVAVPVVVLNACRSAMLDADAESAFASLAAALLQSGTRSAVAMGYNLYVSAAEVLFPPFYRRLFESGSVPEAVRAGRQALLAQPKRLSVRGRFPLTHDWLVPVLYQHEDFALAFRPEPAASDSTASPAPTAAPAPPVFGLEEAAPLRTFIGRDGALLQLERALRRRPAGILLHGLGGVGKTTLARGLLDWLAATDGLAGGAFWFSFQEIKSADYVWNRLGERLFGPTFSADVPRPEKPARLAAALHQAPLLLVWDNFEVVAGLPGEGEPALSAADRGELQAFLTALYGGATKVVITSRGEERWLGEARLPLPLGGLQGEERWHYCETLLEDLNLKIDRNDPDLKELMDRLGGHPLAMRVILRELEKRPARALIRGLEADLEALGLAATDESARLFATLRFPFARLPEELRPLLIPLALHERFVVGDHLEAMARAVGSALPRGEIDHLLGRLTVAGLLRDLGQAVYEMHPALTGFLRSRERSALPPESREPWARAFVDVLGTLANDLAPRPLHEQRWGFFFHRANFRAALVEAEGLGMKVSQTALLQALAVHAENLRDFTEAAGLFGKLAEAQKEREDPAGEAAAYHQLGNTAYEQRDFAAAERWYHKSLEIQEKNGNELGAALTYHQLGMAAYEQRDFAAAERWYRKSLEIKEKTGNETGAASTYHQLGAIAEEQRDFAAAERWYRKALEIFEKTGNETSAATTYHQLGRIAEKQRHFANAERWYRKAFEIFEKTGYELGAASTYHQLGMITQKQRDFAAAERWYRNSLQISEKAGYETGAATTYHQLGMIAEEQRDFAAAERWYRKSLEIKEKNGNEPGTATTYGQLGILAGLQERFEESGRWLLRALGTFLRWNDPHGAQLSARNFGVIYRRAPAAARLTLRALWEESGVGEWPFGEEE